MIDYFALFDLSQRPGIDLAVLDDRYARKSESIKPEQTEALLDLNRGYQTLRDHAARLEHLLLLSGDYPRSNSLDSRVGELFEKTASALARSTGLRQKIGEAESLLVRAVRLQQAQPALAELYDVAGELEAAFKYLLNQLAILDQKWPTDDPQLLDQLARLTNDFRFIQRWRGGVQELISQFRELG